MSRATVGFVETMYCAICGTDRELEQPPCADGHVECPEWVCVTCGTAIVAGWLGNDAPASRHGSDAAA